MNQQLAFYVTVSTEPIHSVENKCGCGASLVLVDVPSRKMAERWADNFAQKTFLDRQHDQKLKEIHIVQLPSSLISIKGREEIDWSHLSNQVQDAAKDPRHQFELCSSGGLFSPSPSDTPSSAKEWGNPKTLRTQVSKEHGDKMNWNELYPAFFVFHDVKKAIIVKGSNSLAASIPFIKDTGDDKPSGGQVYLNFLTWIEEYKNS